MYIVHEFRLFTQERVVWASTIQPTATRHQTDLWYVALFLTLAKGKLTEAEKPAPSTQNTHFYSVLIVEH